MIELSSGPEGILPVQSLRAAAATGVIESGKFKIPDSSFQPASLDLRLGDRAYRLRCSFLPHDTLVQAKLSDFVMGEIPLRDGGILERNRPYLIPLIEELRLPQHIYGKTNPRSSTGRLDIFTRVITDHSHRFDEIRPGYHGKLFLEVASRSFPIHVKEGLSLNQLRLIHGEYKPTDQAILDFHNRTPLIFVDGEPAKHDELTAADGLFLSIDATGDENNFVGYKAKKNTDLLDLCAVGKYNAERFWEPVFGERKHRLVLEPEDLYLLLSAERVRIPPELAAEMIAYDPTSGELRTHYAGFFDPGFGYDTHGLLKGARAVMEVRAHDVPFMVEDRQKVCKLEFQRMAEPPSILYGPEIGSSYQYQELTLSKQFRRKQFRSRSPATQAHFTL
jgi:dCTP deaminase